MSEARYLKDNFQAGKALSQVPASWFNMVAKVLNNLSINAANAQILREATGYGWRIEIGAGSSGSGVLDTSQFAFGLKSSSGSVATFNGGLVYVGNDPPIVVSEFTADVGGSTSLSPLWVYVTSGGGTGVMSSTPEHNDSEYRVGLVQCYVDGSDGVSIVTGGIHHVGDITVPIRT